MSCTAKFKYQRTGDIVRDVRDVRAIPPPHRPKIYFGTTLYMSSTTKFKYKTPGDTVTDVRDVRAIPPPTGQKYIFARLSICLLLLNTSIKR